MTGTVKLSSLVTDAVDDLHALDPDRAVRRMQISLEPARDLNHPAESALPKAIGLRSYCPVMPLDCARW